MVTDITKDQTEPGNYFIANYPPFSFWKPEHLPSVEAALARPAGNKKNEPFGLYLHIPFCRKRCKFCYFRVYTDVNAAAIQTYVDALCRENEILSQQPAIAGRRASFVYFGGGTPSYLSIYQLEQLVSRLRRSIGWDQAEEVTFECEPGTLSEPKIRALRDLGVTRLSLGVENLNDQILEENGRAHHSAEVFRAWEWIQKAEFAQTNIDLIAGMIGETTENWHDCVRRTIALEPDSVTIYQLELPFNTRFTKELPMLDSAHRPVPWSTKRAWLEYAMDELGAAGYRPSSAYTMARDKKDGKSSFLYRDSLWHGREMLGTGVASFGFLGNVHYQNLDSLDRYEARLAEGRLPLARALPTTAEDRLIRELILQTKLGWVDAGYFRDKFGSEILEEFADVYADLVAVGYALIHGDRMDLTREGLLRVDALLPRFFAPEYRGDRYA